MTETPNNQNRMIISFLTLRKFIGLLGLSFPFILALGAWFIFHDGLQDSMSTYYHTGMRNVFVGTLCVIGVFLLSYKGYEGIDDLVGTFSCIFAVGMALFPKDPGSTGFGGMSITGIFHFAFTVLFFLTLILFSLFLFTKTDESRPPTRKKLQRNRVYRLCGYVMILCMVLMAVYFLLPVDAKTSVIPYRPVFWLEAVAVVAFGISWMIKGEALLTDEV